jgi:phosphopantothenoylcysteine decarboxylase/phosphopantothenate--cysteine ligase
MYEAAMHTFPGCDWGIFSAAVADFKPAQAVDQKIKKDAQATGMAIELVPTRDILAAAGASKQPHQKVIGFALETQNELENAQAKLVKKQADLIVLNSLRDPGAGFGHDTNQVTLVAAHQISPLPLASKHEVAKQIVQYLIDHL